MRSRRKRLAGRPRPAEDPRHSVCARSAPVRFPVPSGTLSACGVGCEEGPMAVNAHAGKPAETSMLVNVPRLMTAYYTAIPDPAVPAQRVAFGTSGHRGSAFEHAFNEAHIVAITEAICLYRSQQGIDGPLFLGIDTHALSEAAFCSALEVLAARGVEVMIDAEGGYT